MFFFDVQVPSCSGRGREGGRGGGGRGEGGGGRREGGGGRGEGGGGGEEVKQEMFLGEGECMYVCMYVWMDGWMDGGMEVQVSRFLYYSNHKTQGKSY